MKQVSLQTIRRLALTEKKLDGWMRYMAADWFKENAMDMAVVALGLRPTTNYGTWPKGWKREMKMWAKAEAEKQVLADFMRDEVLQLDGAYWLKRIDTIERLNSTNAEVKHDR